LPVKRTTKHVPRPEQPVGSIDSKGRQKVRDKITGVAKRVSRRKGGALDFFGNVTSKKLS